MRKANRKMKKLTVADGLTDPNYGQHGIIKTRQIINRSVIIVAHRVTYFPRYPYSQQRNRQTNRQTDIKLLYIINGITCGT